MEARKHSHQELRAERKDEVLPLSSIVNGGLPDTPRTQLVVNITDVNQLQHREGGREGGRERAAEGRGL